MQGRVFSFLMSAGKLMLPFGLLISGQLTEQFGVRFWYFIAGGGWLLINLVSFFLPVVVNIEEEYKAVVEVLVGGHVKKQET
jgi:MFS family permease